MPNFYSCLSSLQTPHTKHFTAVYVFRITIVAQTLFDWTRCLDLGEITSGKSSLQVWFELVESKWCFSWMFYSKVPKKLVLYFWQLLLKHLHIWLLVSVIVNCFGSLHEDHQKPGGSTDNYTGEKFKLYTSLIVRSIHSKIMHDLVPEKMWLYFIHK